MLSCLFQDRAPSQYVSQRALSPQYPSASCPARLWSLQLSYFSSSPEISCEYKNHIHQGPHYLDSQRHEGFRVPQVSSLFL